MPAFFLGWKVEELPETENIIFKKLTNVYSFNLITFFDRLIMGRRLIALFEKQFCCGDISSYRSFLLIQRPIDIQHYDNIFQLYRVLNENIEKCSQMFWWKIFSQRVFIETTAVGRVVFQTEVFCWKKLNIFVRNIQLENIHWSDSCRAGGGRTSGDWLATTCPTKTFATKMWQR